MQALAALAHADMRAADRNRGVSHASCSLHADMRVRNEHDGGCGDGAGRERGRERGGLVRARGAGWWSQGGREEERKGERERERERERETDRQTDRQTD